MPRKFEEPPRDVRGFLSWINEGGMDRLKNVLYVVLGPPIFVGVSWSGGHHVFAICVAGLVMLPVLALMLNTWEDTPPWLAKLSALAAVVGIPLLLWLGWQDWQH